jgi:hypothetical protein
MGQISQTYLNPGQPEQYQADQKEHREEQRTDERGIK